MPIERDWTPERVGAFQKATILAIYYEFVYHSQSTESFSRPRDQRVWDAGMEVVNNIGRDTPWQIGRLA